MTLISIIIALALDHTIKNLQDIRDLSWFEYLKENIASSLKLTNKYFLLFIYVFPPVIFVAFLQYVLSDFLYNIPALVFGVLVLFYSLGPASLSNNIDSYLDARSQGDIDETLHYAGVITETTVSTSPDQQTSDVVKAILSITNERIFSVIFWFIITGPIGAILYRLLSNIAKQNEQEEPLKSLATFLLAILAWVPARLLAIAYALSGNFEGAVKAYSSREYEPDIASNNTDVLVNTGLGALRDHESQDELSGLRAVKGLILRSIIFWVSMLAILTLGGWLG